MAIGSGLGASLGIKTETTWGTYAAPDRFFEFTSESLTGTKQIVQGGGIAAGRMAKAANQRVMATQAANGPLDLEVQDAKFGVFLEHIFGAATAWTQVGATGAYGATYTVGDVFGKGLTVQVGRPDTTGTVNANSYLGGKLKSAEFSCAANEPLTLSLDFDFKEESTSQTLAAASYVASRPFHYCQLAVKMGNTAGTAVALDGVRGFNVKIERPLADDLYHANNQCRKSQPVQNGFVEVSGSLDLTYTGAVVLSKILADTQQALIFEFTGGPVGTGANSAKFSLTIDAAFFDGDRPNVGNVDVLNFKSSFVGLVPAAGGSPITATYQSGDTTA